MQDLVNNSERINAYFSDNEINSKERLRLAVKISLGTINILDGVDKTG